MQSKLTLRWLVAAVSCAVALLVPVAIASAEGEEDAGFGNAGTAFADLNDTGGLESAPVVDQAPDGTLVEAVGLRLRDKGSRGTDERNEIIRLVRYTPAGQPTGLDGDGIVDQPVFDVDNLFDMEILPDGRIVIVGEADLENRAGRSNGDVYEGFVVWTFTPAGVLDTANEFPAPECMPEEAEPTTAQLAPDGSAYALWGEDSCEEGTTQPQERGNVPIEPAIEHFDGDTRDTRALPTMLLGVDVALGQDGSVYVLGDSTPLTRGGFGRSVVVKLDGALQPQLEYGPDVELAPGQAFVEGLPVDLAVDSAGRALVWVDARPEPVRGGEGRWEVWRLDANGDAEDPGWGGGDGVATVENGLLGPARCFCTESRRTSYLRVVSGDKVVMLGLGPRTPDRGIFTSTLLATVRLESDGDPDPLWDGDGIKTLELVQPTDGLSQFVEDNEPAEQSDGRLLVPYVVFTELYNVNRVPAALPGGSLGLTRLTAAATPAGGGGTTQQPSQQPQVQAPAVIAASAAVPRQCRSRRAFRIRLRTGRRKGEKSPIVSARVTVNGRRVRVVRQGRYRARVNLRNLPRGRFVVRIRLRLKDGGIVRETRRYRTCRKRIPHDLGPLRTRPPKKKGR